MTTVSDIQNIRAEVKRLIVDVTNLRNLDADTIGDDQLLFGSGLGLDSIDLLELVIAIQRRYGLKLKNDPEGQKALYSVSTLSDAIHQHFILCTTPEPLTSLESSHTPIRT